MRRHVGKATCRKNQREAAWVKAYEAAKKDGKNSADAIAAADLVVSGVGFEGSEE